ncbi:hypothetical protein GCM10023144_28130 [Pigmentiphaga soli]|uniref:Copper chaperone PCu(A)C n=1 Tax=Pigmentiphaga soli TaxID=1007095 RepID=A0ABP8H711_9BURK
MKFRTLFAALPLALAAFGAHAHGYKLGQIDIGHPWSRATVAGQPTGGGFMKLTNHGADDKLVAVRSDISASAELHTMKMEDNVMRMRQVDGIALPAGKTVELSPGGLHIMFMKLKAPLKQGESFPATLVFEKAGQIKVDFKIEAPGAGAGGHDMHGMEGHGMHGDHGMRMN